MSNANKGSGNTRKIPNILIQMHILTVAGNHCVNAERRKFEMRRVIDEVNLEWLTVAVVISAMMSCEFGCQGYFY